MLNIELCEAKRFFFDKSSFFLPLAAVGSVFHFSLVLKLLLWLGGCELFPYDRFTSDPRTKEIKGHQDAAHRQSTHAGSGKLNGVQTRFHTFHPGQRQSYNLSFSILCKHIYKKSLQAGTDFMLSFAFAIIAFLCNLLSELESLGEFPITRSHL